MSMPLRAVEDRPSRKQVLGNYSLLTPGTYTVLTGLLWYPLGLSSFRSRHLLAPSILIYSINLFLLNSLFSPGTRPCERSPGACWNFCLPPPFPFVVFFSSLQDLGLLEPKPSFGTRLLIPIKNGSYCLSFIIG